jgi:hypothetical protein
MHPRSFYAFLLAVGHVGADHCEGQRKAEVSCPRPYHKSQMSARGCGGMFTTKACYECCGPSGSPPSASYVSHYVCPTYVGRFESSRELIIQVKSPDASDDDSCILPAWNVDSQGVYDVYDMHVYYNKALPCETWASVEQSCGPRDGHTEAEAREQVGFLYDIAKQACIINHYSDGWRPNPGAHSCCKFDRPAEGGSVELKLW